MQLIVTGASGFIGRNVLLRAPRDWQIAALYNQTTDLPAFVDAHRLTHVTAAHCDLLVPESVSGMARRFGRADAVLHLAANGDPAASAARPRWDLQLNTLALVTLLEHASINRMVFLSSGAVYDGLSGEVTPATPVDPTLPYAIGKLASERYVRFFAERRRALASYANIRFFGAYGPHEAPRKITTRWLRAVMAGRREFTIRGDGRNLIDFMYVDDAVDAMLRVAADASFSGTVDLACGTPVTVNAVVEGMARALGVDVTVHHDGEVPEYIEFRSADTTLRDRYGFVPAVPFEDGVRRLAAFFAAAEAHAAGRPA